MNYDISKWLKDELGLNHMSESDLNGLIYHPRYGGLCRRLVNFLAESTLCNIKYSNVYAKEHYAAAINECKDKNHNLISSLKELEEVAREGENNMRELDFLKSRLSQMKTIQQLLKNYSESLEEIADRPNIQIEEFSQNLNNPEYLTDSSLASIYELEDDFKPDTVITSRQMSTIDEKLNRMVRKIESIHKSATKLAQSINAKENNIYYDDSLTMTKIDDLQALKIPPIEEEIEDPHQDEKVFRDLNSDLTREVVELDQQVAKLGDQYRKRKMEIGAATIPQLEQCLLVLGEISGPAQSNRNGSSSSLDNRSCSTLPDRVMRV